MQWIWQMNYFSTVLRWDRGLFACSTISPYFTISLQLEIRGHGNIKKGKIEVPYRPLLRRPKFNAGPYNAGPNNAGSKKLENKEGLFFHDLGPVL